MLKFRELKQHVIFNEMTCENQSYWFDFKEKKFLHNVDTFYYSVKFFNDFTTDSTDPAVHQLRKFFKERREFLDSRPDQEYLPVRFGDLDLNLLPITFAHRYTVCLQCPEWFDIFIAPIVPGSVSGIGSVTCEVVVQLRSYMLWMYGVKEAYERSYLYVQKLADYFSLQIAFTQENRVDYCWHTNYFSSPEQFFTPDNFYKMRVDRFHGANFHTEKVGSEDFEIDYISLGKRSDKIFIRIYLKSKEVVEEGYKAWFLYTWLFHGLINRYDLYVYEECYRRKSWQYLNMARISFYLEYGMDETLKVTCRRLLSGEQTMEEDVLRQFADSLTPKVNLIINVEYQTMRRHSKSYTLLPLRDNSAKETSKRIYDYFDNRKLILDYLTREVFRLVDPRGDVNKSRRDFCPFWKALRSCRLIDVHIPPKHLKLIRTYTRKLNGDLVKARALNSVVMYGFYMKGINDDTIMQDVVDALCRMNDNDMQKVIRYKNKKSRQFNSHELPGSVETISDYAFDLVDHDTGEIYSHNSMKDSENQEVIK